MNFLSKFKKQAILVALGTVLVGTNLATYKITYNHFKAKEAKTQAAVLESIALQDKLNRAAIRELQEEHKELESQYVELKRKKNKVKIVNADCTLTSDAVSLWNESLLGKGDVSPRPTGTTNGTGISIADALDNKFTNDERCNKLRAQLHSIKEWDKKTFGD